MVLRLYSSKIVAHTGLCRSSLHSSANILKRQSASSVFGLLVGYKKININCSISVVGPVSKTYESTLMEQCQ